MKLEKLATYGSTQAVLQNLKDAGCTKEMTQQIIMKLEKMILKNCQNFWNNTEAVF